MKVQTDVRAGAVLEAATEQASAAANDVANFISTADQQATDLTTSLVNKATSIWNCVTAA
jgi:hypothetical protein